MDSDRRKLTLEDLLKVKRAEKPSAEFWRNFEQELRAKQLAAIVQREPWWHRASMLFRTWQGISGAAAIAVVVVGLGFRTSSVESSRETLASSDLSTSTVVGVTVGSAGITGGPAPESWTDLVPAAALDQVASVPQQDATVAAIVSAGSVEENSPSISRLLSPTAVALPEIVAEDLAYSAPQVNREYVQAVRPAEPLAQVRVRGDFVLATLVGESERPAAGQSQRLTPSLDRRELNQLDRRIRGL